MGPFTWLAFKQAQKSSLQSRVRLLADLQSKFTEQDQLRLLSKGIEHGKGELLYSMVKIKDFATVQPGQPATYEDLGGKTGQVLIPDDLLRLRAAFQFSSAWCFNITESDKQKAFEVHLNAGSAPLGDVRSVKLTWGTTSGIVSLVIGGMFEYKIDLPVGFDVDTLMLLLYDGGRMRQFIMDHARLNRSQLEQLRINPNGF